MTRDELKRRQADYERYRWIAGAIGAAPLLSVYLLVHTPQLRAFLPDSKLLSVVILFFVPLGWLVGVTRLYNRWGARHFGLQCPRCGTALVGEGLQHSDNRVECRRCGTAVDDFRQARSDR